MPVPISRRDWGITSSAAIPTPSAAIPYDTRPISEVQMLAIHIYVYGGLVFFIAVVISALIWYAYIICYHRKMRDLPEELHFDEDFVLATKNLPRRPGFRVEAYACEERSEREKATKSPKDKEETKKAREVHAAVRRKNKKDSQLSTKNRDSQRISWASSVATLKTDKLTSAEEMSGLLKSQKKEDRASMKTDYLPRPASDAYPKSILISIPTLNTKSDQAEKAGSFQFSDVGSVTPVPQAHTELPRTQVHVEPNANIGQEMIATTGPAEAESWSGPRCTCNAASEGIDALIQKAMCQVHRFN